jgi:N-acetylglucosaminyldiphosphoundecaprenol N-acetyl-beta-D-mannosaminyltransferase
VSGLTGHLKEKVDIMGVGIHPFTLEEAVAVIAGWIEQAGPQAGSAKGGLARQVITLNPEMLCSARQDPAVWGLLNRGDLVVPDGHGILWAGKRLGCPFPERVTGIDLIQALAVRAADAGWRLYLLGGAPGVAEAAAINLQRQHPGLQVVGTGHGYFSAMTTRSNAPASLKRWAPVSGLTPGLKENGHTGKSGYVPGSRFLSFSGGRQAPTEAKDSLTGAELPAVLDRIRAAHPDLLLVGMGFPKQEYFIRDHRQDLGSSVAVGVGGSFDVISGRLRRSPVWIQRLRLEWLYRAFQEPARWRRLLVLPRFIGLVLTESGNRGMGSH